MEKNGSRSAERDKKVFSFLCNVLIVRHLKIQFIMKGAWRKRLDNIECSLNKIRRKLKKAEETNAYIKQDLGDEVIYCFKDRELGEWFDSERKKY